MEIRLPCRAISPADHPLAALVVPVTHARAMVLASRLRMALRIPPTIRHAARHASLKILIPSTHANQVFALISEKAPTIPTRRAEEEDAAEIDFVELNP